MGVISDLLTSGSAFDVSSPRVGSDNSIYRNLSNVMDIDYPEAYAAADEVQVIGQFTGGVPASGNYTLTIVGPDGTEYTTANILYNATAATIQTAIDTAVDGTYEAGDIVVTDEGAAGLSDGDVTLTFSGDSVTGLNFGLTVATDVDLSAGDPGAVTVTTEGQPDRKALAGLYAAGVIGGTLPAFGETPADLEALNTRASYPGMINAETIKALARQAVMDGEHDDTYATVLSLAGIE
jgi:hypothetical protein